MNKHFPMSDDDRAKAKAIFEQEYTPEHFQWIPVSQIQTHPSSGEVIQREQLERKSQEIAYNLRPELLGTLMVAKFRNQYWCTDGGHRLWALQNIDLDLPVQCYVIDLDADPQAATQDVGFGKIADLVIALNDTRRSMSAYDKAYVLALTKNDPFAVTLKRLAGERDLDVVARRSGRDRNRKISAIKAFKDIYTDVSRQVANVLAVTGIPEDEHAERIAVVTEHTLAKTMDLILAVWSEDDYNFDRYNVLGTGYWMRTRALYVPNISCDLYETYGLTTLEESRRRIDRLRNALLRSGHSVDRIKSFVWSQPKRYDPSVWADTLTQSYYNPFCDEAKFKHEHPQLTLMVP